jgi:hypothetical protein
LSLRIFGRDRRADFQLAFSPFRDGDYEREDVRENSVFDSGGSDLHERVRAYAAELQEERQELPNERQQSLQLREELQLLRL